MDTSNEKILRPNKAKMLFMLFLSLLFIIAGIMIILKGETLKGWFVVITFSLSLAVELVLMLPNSSFLRLTPTGFTVCSMYRSATYKWSDVSRFEVTRIVTRKTVVFNFSPKRTGPMLKAANALAGYDGALPTTYGFRAEELAKLMNDYRERDICPS